MWKDRSLEILRNVLSKTVIFNYAYQGRKDCDPGNFHENIMTEAGLNFLPLYLECS